MKKKLFLLSILSLSLLAVGCQPTVTAQDQRNTQRNGKNIVKAIAHVKPVDGSNVEGTVTFSELERGVRIVADIKGLTPGEHGFHVHEHGDCGGKGGENTGGHYNPFNKKHGGPDSSERHVGDFGNLVADDAGIAHYERTDDYIQLNGEYSIVGRSIVIHAGKDDLVSQPSGNSGAKIGCGIIEAQK
ncbi:Superoxide dismutase [Cu-Zn] precursor [Candidatus Rubidus massiliensis]|nr:MAG: hypothetical protein BGO10_10630 [Chlamydia sp. 32-24]CDZ80529.1 Superoxide dismutase [Cu-Zn] precursor [Candidatus Rubidus massiliensis]